MFLENKIDEYFSSIDGKLLPSLKQQDTLLLKTGNMS